MARRRALARVVDGSDDHEHRRQQPHVGILPRTPAPQRLTCAVSNRAQLERQLRTREHLTMVGVDGRVALITGAGQGVGQGIAFALAAEGAAPGAHLVENDTE